MLPGKLLFLRCAEALGQKPVVIATLTEIYLFRCRHREAVSRLKNLSIACNRNSRH